MNCRSLLRHVMTHGVGCKPVIYMLIGMADDVPGVSGHFAPVRSALMLCSASHEVATCCNKSEVLFASSVGLGCLSPQQYPILDTETRGPSSRNLTPEP